MWMWLKESAQLARFNILQQAGTAMLAQANQSTQSILRLLGLIAIDSPQKD
jgi:flagellin